jgi:hypothetical protein
MKRLLLVIVALASVTAQESTLPEGHYCQRHPPRPSQVRAHQCACDYVCMQNPDGTYDYHEDTTCKAYCRKHACTCWPEAPCPKPK